MIIFLKQVPILLSGNGEPIANKTDILTAGKYGPALLQDFVFLDEMSHFDRERIPERVVHAKGAGDYIFNSDNFYTGMIIKNEVYILSLKVFTVYNSKMFLLQSICISAVYRVAFLIINYFNLGYHFACYYFCR